MDIANSFSHSEYLITFLSLVLGFVVSEFFEGLGTIIRYFKRYKHHSQFMLLAFLILLMELIYWWNTWSRSEQMTESIGSFLITIPYPLLFYCLFMVLFRNISHSYDLSLQYASVRRNVWALLCVYFIYDYAEGLFSTLDHYRLIGFFIALVGLIFRSNRIQWLTILSGYLFVAFYLYQDYHGQLPSTNGISGYSRVEHLIVFLSFVFGFVVVEFLKGWARLINHYREIRLSLIHILWTVYTFLLMIDIWWSNWILRMELTSTQLYFLIILIKPFIIYVIALFHFPSDQDRIRNYWDYFISVKTYVFYVYAVLLIFNVALSFYFQINDQEFYQNILRFAGVVFAILTANAHTKIQHWLLLLIALLLFSADLIFKFNPV
jgi:hypothetical protein